MKAFTTLGISLIVIVLIVLSNCYASQLALQSNCVVDSLPLVLNNPDKDLISMSLKNRAYSAFRKITTPTSLEDWAKRKEHVSNFISESTNYRRYPDLPLGYKETKVTKCSDYEIRNIIFQTRPGIWATANLYVPNGDGIFPAVIVMMGHAREGKSYPLYQAVGHKLAENGYVALLVDPWGAGERTTFHGESEYHGGNLGASLMNIGETLMGMQITDNIRGVDLLCSLPFVNKNQIGATGASGGGNQTMWLAAVDDRIRAAIPVVSVGTFESYVVNSNCVCELLPDGLTFLEESDILGLIAPRSLGIFNAIHDGNRAFSPSEMFRSFENARKIYRLYDSENKLSYQLFNTDHGYKPEMRNEMIAWFDANLRYTASSLHYNHNPVNVLSQSDLMVFEIGDRFKGVIGTAEYCRKIGGKLRNAIFGAWVYRHC